MTNTHASAPGRNPQPVGRENDPRAEVARQRAVANGQPPGGDARRPVEALTQQQLVEKGWRRQLPQTGFLTPSEAGEWIARSFEQDMNVRRGMLRNVNDKIQIQPQERPDFVRRIIAVIMRVTGVVEPGEGLVEKLRAGQGGPEGATAAALEAPEVLTAQQLGGLLDRVAKLEGKEATNALIKGLTSEPQTETPAMRDSGIGQPELPFPKKTIDETFDEVLPKLPEFEEAVIKIDGAPLPPTKLKDLPFQEDPPVKALRSPEANLSSAPDVLDGDGEEARGENEVVE